MSRFAVLAFVVLAMVLAVFGQNLQANAQIAARPYRPVMKPYAPSRVFYSLYMGLNIPKDMDFSESRSGQRGSVRLESGGNFAGALGFRFSRHLRMEAELGYSEANFNRIKFSGGAGDFDLGGELVRWTGLLSLYYDAPVDWKIRPFIGAGAGFAYHEGDLNDRSGLTGFSVDDSDRSFIWQLSGGLRYDIGPGVGLSAGYRYLNGQDLGFEGYNIDYGSHEFRVGLDYDIPVKKPKLLK